MDGQAPLPLTYRIGRFCEEFPAYGPEEAYLAWQRLPVGFLEEIIEGRAYAAAKAALDRAGDAEGKRNVMRDWPLAGLAWEIEMNITAARQAAAHAE